MAHLIVVPDGWLSQQVGSFLQLTSGKSKPKSELDERKGCSSVPVYGGNGINGYCNEELVYAPTVVIGRVGEYCGCVHITTGKSWITDNALYVRELIDGYDLHYVHHLLDYSELRRLRKVSGQPLVSQQPIYDLSVVTPPLPEQQKIAAILSSVDEVIENTRAQIDKLKDLKTGMMQELLTKGVGENGKPHTEFKDSPVGRIPVGWDVKHLNELVTIKHGYAFEGEHFSTNQTEHILLTPGNFHRDGRLYFGPKTKYYAGPIPEGYILQNGDVLVVMTDLTKEMTILGNTISLHSPSIVLHNQRIGKVQPIHDKKIIPDYLCLVMNSDQVKSHIKDTATGTTVRHTSPSKILEPLVPVPSINEQIEIMKVIKTVGNLLTTNEQKLSTYKNTKKALMQDLLTGKVRVKTNNTEVAVS